MTALFCTDTLTARHTGAGDAGAHTTKIGMMPGRFALLIGGTVGASTTTAKLEDADGNLYALPDPTGAADAAIPTVYPVEFVNPGCTLVIATTGATAPTDLTITVANLED